MEPTNTNSNSGVPNGAPLGAPGNNIPSTPYMPTGSSSNTAPNIPPPQHKGGLLKSLSILGIVLVVAGLVGLTNTKTKKAEVVDNTTPTDTTTPTEDPAGTIPTGTSEENPVDAADNPVPVTPASKYKDGTYSAAGNYTSPGGLEEIEATLTIKGDIIVGASLTPMAENPASLGFQKTVASNLKTFVIGKNLDEVQLTKVSGSSLTPKGFNEAVARIKREAAVEVGA